MHTSSCSTRVYRQKMKRYLQRECFFREQNNHCSRAVDQNEHGPSATSPKIPGIERGLSVRHEPTAPAAVAPTIRACSRCSLDQTSHRAVCIVFYCSTSPTADGRTKSPAQCRRQAPSATDAATLIRLKISPISHNLTSSLLLVHWSGSSYWLAIMPETGIDRQTNIRRCPYSGPRNYLLLLCYPLLLLAFAHLRFNDVNFIRIR